MSTTGFQMHLIDVGNGSTAVLEHKETKESGLWHMACIIACIACIIS